MDRKGWVMRAVEALRFASFKDIQRYLDEEGEAFSKKELEDTLKGLGPRGEAGGKRRHLPPSPQEGGRGGF